MILPLGEATLSGILGVTDEFGGAFSGQPDESLSGVLGAAPPLSACVAVIPLRCLAGTPLDAVIGELVADGVIAQLSRTPELTVLSRLSTATLRGREVPLRELHALTGARYVLSGSYAAHEETVLLTVELADAKLQTVLWSDRLRCRVAALLEQPSEVLDRIAQAAHAAILETEARQAASRPRSDAASAGISRARSLASPRSDCRS